MPTKSLANTTGFVRIGDRYKKKEDSSVNMASTPRETTGDDASQKALNRIADYTVVDTDVHEINVDVSKYAKYLDEPWRSRVEHKAGSVEPLTQGLVGSFNIDLDPTPHGLDKDIKTTTPDGLKAFMDRFNTDYILLHGHTFEALNTVHEKDWAAALCSAYNDYLLDNFLDEHERIKGSIRVPAQAPNKGAEEIHRLANEDQMVSVHIVAPTTLLGDSEFDPLFDAAESEGLNIDVHPGWSNLPWYGLYGGPDLQSTVEYYSVLNQHNYAHVPSMIFNGVPERFPDLEFLFLEQGITWIPHMLSRMDKNYERRKHVLPNVERKPSEYVSDHFYFGTQPIEDRSILGTKKMLDILDMIDAKNTLMYSTDFPHFDFDYPTFMTIPGIDEETERAVFGENAIEVFDF